MEILSEKIVKCRKPHICHGCRSKIEIGEYAGRSVAVDGGKILMAYWCETCQKVMAEMDSYDLDGGFGFGELIDNMEEEWQRIKSELKQAIEIIVREETNETTN